MHKNFFLIFFTIVPSIIFAHTLILNIDNNEDNTINIEGLFSTGEIAAGAQIRLESLIDGKILYKKRLSDDGALTINIPSEPYIVILDGGPKHKATKKGVPPLQGFKKLEIVKETKNTNTYEKNISKNIIIIIGILIISILFFITILISKKNTNKLIEELYKSRKNSCLKKN